MGGPLDRAAGLPALASAEAVTGIVRPAEADGASGPAQATPAASELDRLLDAELDQLHLAATRRAELLRSAARDEVERIRLRASRSAAALLAEARADVVAARSAADAEAAVLVRSAAAQAEQARIAAAEEARCRRAAAMAAAEELRAQACGQAATLRSEALGELLGAVEARRTAEREAEARRAAAGQLIAEIERPRAGSEDEGIAIYRGDTEVPRNGLAGAVATMPSVGIEPAPAVRPSGPFLVPALSLGRELLLRMLVLGGILTSAWFWLWWIDTGHGTWSPGAVVVTLLLAWVLGLPAYFYFFACRMTRPNRSLPVPDLRLAMVVTKAPSEPWPMVRQTLEAMLAQDLDRPHDVWLADERVMPETLRWCEDNGVQVSTREGVNGYHRDEWPRRKRSKEGNLAYFYDHFGYERYDVVVQLDADHVPTSSYLEEMVRPFGDPGVGYVSAPSICDANADQGWTVRGRLYREATLHGPVQAGSNDGYGPVCIGSHYAVRTAALREVGGLGPELAEDYSTTLFLQSHGWAGVFNIDAEAHGDGPESLDEMLVQEVQWARSLGTILVRWAPSRLRRVPWRARLRLGFALAFYPLQGIALVVTMLLPLIGVALRASWGQTSIAGFYLHIWPGTLVGLATVAYLRRCGLLRPEKAKLWSWELMLFQLVRWPWTFWGFFQGMVGGLRSTVLNFKVTPKGTSGMKPLRPTSLAPTLALAVAPALAVVLVRDPGPALGLQVLAGAQAITYLTCAVAVVLLHLAANRRRNRIALQPAGTRWLTWDSGGRSLLLLVAVAGPTGAALAWRLTT